MKCNNGLPSITVLMSVYNGEQWLKEAITSVLSQTFSDFEFVIVNDGSVDNSLLIIKEFALTDQRIKILDKPNSGLADSLNYGIAHASGQWIARLDADDICELTRLEKQYNFVKQNQQVVFVGTALTLINENGEDIKIHYYPERHDVLLKHLQTVRKFPPHSSAFYRADIVKRIKGYNKKIKHAEDWDLWLRLSEIGRFSTINEPLVKIRKHPNQISHFESGSRQLTDSRVALVSYWLRKFGENDPVDQDDEGFLVFRDWIEVQLKESGFYKYQHFKLELKKYISRGDMYGVFRTVFFNFSFLFMAIKEHFLGENLTYKIALNWIKYRLSLEI